MKSKIFFLSLVLSLISVFSLKAQQFIYCEILGNETSVSKQLIGVGKSKITIELDFGNVQNDFKDNRLRGEDGKPMKFNSMVDAMNWMGSKGWEFCQAYVVTEDKQNVYHWLLKLDISVLSEDDKNEVLSAFKVKQDFKKQ